MKHRARNAYLVFLLIGLAMLIPGLVIGVNNALLISTGNHAEGTILEYQQSTDSDGGLQYTPVYRYTADGQTYTRASDLSTSWRPYDIGETVSVLYRSGHPEKGRLNRFAGLWMIPLIFGGMGLIFAAVGGFGLSAVIRRKNIAEELQYSGQRIDTVYQHVKKGSLKVNNKHSYKIVSQGTNPQNGEVLLFESDLLWFNPEQFMAAGQVIQVAIDPSNPKRHWMDISFLPEYNG